VNKIDYGSGMAVLCSALSVTAAAAQDKKPNIIIIMADDLGYHDLGFQGAENIKTPNVDKLAAGGMVFTDGHVAASVCSPSRAGMMTGRYQHRFGHEANCPPRGKGMDVTERTIGQAMQDLGYHTAIFGKWHLGDAPQFYPNVRGFDEFWGLREGSRSYWYKKSEAKRDNPRNIEHNGKQVAFEGHLTDRLGDRAVEYIEKYKDEPFFMYLSFTAPHGPLQSKPEDKKALGNGNDYEGLVYGLDRNIGKVTAALKANGLTENTLIWFLSDNGGIAKQSSNLPLGGQKGTEFEGGQRVPFVVSFPAKIPAGTRYSNMVSSLDIYPTSVVLAGGSLDQPKPLDGVDLMPYLTSKKKGVPHKELYWRRLDCAAVREGPWKLIRVENLGYGLFNIDKDISESDNLADRMPEKVAEMSRKIEKWETGLIAPLWNVNKIWIKYRYESHKKRFEMNKGKRNKLEVGSEK